MIKSFKHRGLEDLFYSGTKRGIKAQYVQKISDILDRLDSSKETKDMRFPGSNLHRLKGEMKGLWAVKVTGNWRIVFSFREGNACNVDYKDYH